MNQEWARGGVSCSAVPVLPDTGPPGTPASSGAVPRVTTSRIIGASAAVTPGGTAAGGRATAVGRSGTRVGVGTDPRTTVAAMSASDSGLTRSVPCPNAFAATAAGSPPGV